MIYRNKTEEFYIGSPTAVTLGKFDGLHRGHQLLIDRLIGECICMHYNSAAFTFDIPPRNLLEGSHQRQILTQKEKIKAFSEKNLDYLMECPFTENVRNMTPYEFIRWIVHALHIQCFVVGEDFHFGKGRAGDASFLMEHEIEFGYRTIVVPKIRENDREISSTYVREALSAGHIELANQLLGYSYYVSGQVEEDTHIGHEIGIPTANLLPSADKFLPPFGVYVTGVCLDGERMLPGVTNVGCKPTIEGNHPIGVETHILDFEGDLYGKEITVEFLTQLRGEYRFDSVDLLREQMRRDILMARTYFKI